MQAASYDNGKGETCYDYKSDHSRIQTGSLHQHRAGLILYYDNMNYINLRKYYSETLGGSAPFFLLGISDDKFYVACSCGGGGSVLCCFQALIFLYFHVEYAVSKKSRVCLRIPVRNLNAYFHNQSKQRGFKGRREMFRNVFWDLLQTVKEEGLWNRR